MIGVRCATKCGKSRENHPDKKYCVREMAAALQPSPAQVRKETKGEGKKEWDRNGKKKVPSPNDRRSQSLPFWIMALASVMTKWFTQGKLVHVAIITC